mmetsp:Transcript_56836/g.163151  ORF Transcript_56836/g.163151 Transcript_56836/m.163151 type:complete len:228 (+) Transcript_56836:898-1581(+)
MKSETSLASRTADTLKSHLGSPLMYGSIAGGGRAAESTTRATRNRASGAASARKLRSARRSSGAARWLATSTMRCSPGLATACSRPPSVVRGLSTSTGQSKRAGAADGSSSTKAERRWKRGASKLPESCFGATSSPSPAQASQQERIRDINRRCLQMPLVGSSSLYSRPSGNERGHILGDASLASGPEPAPPLPAPSLAAAETCSCSSTTQKCRSSASNASEQRSRQ